MSCRLFVCWVLLALPAMLLIACSSSPNLSSIQVSPATATLGAAGTTVQFKATGTYTNGSHPSVTRDITNQVTWASSDSGAATVNSSGLATAVNSGSTSITATMSSSFGPVSGSASLTVTGGTAPGVHDLTALAIIPATGVQTLYALGETAQFLAIGTFSSSPVTQDMTDLVTWQSSVTDVATIGSTGLATAQSCASTSCITTITASATSATGSDIVATSNLTVDPLPGGSGSPSLAVYTLGVGTGTVVSSPPGINCIAGAGCSASFTSGASVTLTAAPSSGSTFGGWSANCTPSTATTCTVVMSGNQTVGAIFN